MEYQKIINLLDNTPNQPSKFKTKSWVKINDGSYGMYRTSSQIKLVVKQLEYRFCLQNYATWVLDNILSCL